MVKVLRPVGKIDESIDEIRARRRRLGNEMAGTSAAEEVPLELLLTFWRDQRLQAQRSEDQRAVITNIVLTISAAGLGFLVQKGIQPSTLPASCGLLLLGAYGAISSAKLYERYKLHMAQSAGYAAVIEEIYPGAKLEEARHRMRYSHDQRFSRLSRIRLHLIWIGLHVAIALSGLLFIAIALT